MGVGEGFWFGEGVDEEEAVLGFLGRPVGVADEIGVAHEAKN